MDEVDIERMMEMRGGDRPRGGGKPDRPERVERPERESKAEREHKPQNRSNKGSSNMDGIQGFWEGTKKYPGKTLLTFMIIVMGGSAIVSAITGKTTKINAMHDLLNPATLGSFPGAIIGNGVRDLDRTVVTPTNEALRTGQPITITAPPPGVNAGALNNQLLTTQCANGNQEACAQLN